MLRVACLLTLRDGVAFLPAWAAYHGYMFGYENMFVLADNPQDPDFARLAGAGAHVLPAGEDPLAAQRALIAAIVADKSHDIILPLGADSFIACSDNAGLSVMRASLFACLERVAAAGVTARTAFTAEIVPGRLDRFRMVEARRPILAVAALPEAAVIDETVPLDHAHPVWDILHLRLAGGGLPEDGKPLLGWGGFARLLAQLLPDDAFAAGWTAQPAPAVTSYDLADIDGVFRVDAYTDANPDLRSTVSPLLHYCWAGYREGRRLHQGEDRWAEVARRLAAFRAELPDRPVGYSGLVNAYSPLGKIDEADAIVSDLAARFPNDLGVLREWIQAAFVREDVDAVIRRSAALLAAFPDERVAYEYGMLALRMAQRLDEAEALAEDAMRRFPEDRFLLRLRAENAVMRNDHAAAEARWRHLLDLFPEDGELREVAARYVQSSLAARDEGDGTPDLYEMDAPVEVGMSKAETEAALDYLGLPDVKAMRAMFLGFESLGFSCEFGLVQRRHGAEPLGLLRWNSIQFATLVGALAVRFEGLESPENLFLRRLGEEYVLCDRRYHTAMHTFIYTSQMGGEEVLRRQSKRLKFLRQKLIEDLETGEKIFVHLDHKWASPMDLQRLTTTMRAIGPSRVLYVTVAKDPAQIGTTEIVNDHLMLGWIARQGRDQDGVWGIDFPSWLALTKSARDWAAD
jgi:tetratricopeptide (TPR) repeat protein